MFAISLPYGEEVLTYVEHMFFISSTSLNICLTYLNICFTYLLHIFSYLFFALFRAFILLWENTCVFMGAYQREQWFT